MNLGPMLCVLCTGACMRALQMDPLSDAPQKWAQNCLFMSTYAEFAQVFRSCQPVFAERDPSACDDSLYTDGDVKPKSKVVRLNVYVNVNVNQRQRQQLRTDSENVNDKPLFTFSRL